MDEHEYLCVLCTYGRLYQISSYIEVFSKFAKCENANLLDNFTDDSSSLVFEIFDFVQMECACGLMLNIALLMSVVCSVTSCKGALWHGSETPD